jgi:hypothetical protein
MKEQLKYPVGNFTQDALADLNGVAKMNVYAKLQAAIKAGTLVLVGKVPAKGGKGKPSNLFRVNDKTPGKTVPATLPVTSLTVTVVQPPILDGEPAVVPKSEKDTGQVTVPVTVQVEDLEKIIEKGNKLPVYALSVKCPICNHPLLRGEDETGVTVWCGQKIEVCPSGESPFGHGKTEKAALEVLFNKWHSK